MSPHKTGIEETGASFKKGKLITLREQILYTYHNAEQIDEKLAFLLLRIADVIDKLDPEVVDVAITNLENRIADNKTEILKLREKERK